jgi:hypothetical protein
MKKQFFSCLKMISEQKQRELFNPPFLHKGLLTIMNGNKIHSRIYPMNLLAQYTIERKFPTLYESSLNIS